MDGTIQVEIDLQAFTYADRQALLPALSQAIDLAGGWILERKAASPDIVSVLLEVQTCALADAYAALLTSGLELSRESHRTLAERCNCCLHLRPTSGISSILTIRLEIHFLEDAPPPLDISRLLLLGAAAA